MQPATSWVYLGCWEFDFDTSIFFNLTAGGRTLEWKNFLGQSKFIVIMKITIVDVDQINKNKTDPSTRHCDGHTDAEKQILTKTKLILQPTPRKAS